MLRLARPSGQDDIARAELEELRDRGAPAIDYCKAIAGMCSDMFGAFGMPEIDADLGDWSVPISASAN